MLAAAIQKAYETGSRLLPLLNYHERGRLQLGARVVTHGPADHLADREIEYGCEAVFACRQVVLDTVGDFRAVQHGQ